MVANVSAYTVPVYTGVGGTYPTAFASANAANFSKTYATDQTNANLNTAYQQKVVYCQSI